MKYKSFLIILLLFIAICVEVSAEPAFPDPIIIVQPDGTSLTVLLKGDEFFAYKTTVDGYLITQNSKGFFEYANVNIEGKNVALGGKSAKYK